MLVILATLLVTGGLASQLQYLKLVIDPAKTLPQHHPAVTVSEHIEKTFGSKFVVVIGITPKTGDAFQPIVLEKVRRMTDGLRDTPGVVKGNLLSLAARRAKSIHGTSEGMEVHPLMEAVPQTEAGREALRRALQDNPAYLQAIVSQDGRTAAIIAEFLDDPKGFRGIMEKIHAVVDRERDERIDIAIGGLPAALAQIEIYSERMGILFPLALVIIAAIHYEAFRTIQGLLLPLVTGLLAVIWGLGVMGGAGVPMDTFNATTPILILAVAAGHAVQILKRYYEEYHRLRGTTAMPAIEANQAAVVESVTRVGPAMLTAGIVAALGFFSLVVFDIAAIRTFGIFAGIGILNALWLEMTFIPAVRSWLPPPGEREGRLEREERIWDRLTHSIAEWVTGPNRTHGYVLVGVFLAVLLVGMFQVTVDNSPKHLFAKSLPFQQDDQTLNAQLGGTNSLYLLVEGRGADAIKDPGVLSAMEATQRFLEQQPYVGKTLSLADFVKRMNRAMHRDDPAYDRIPESRDLIAQYLLLYSMSGEPGDFDSYVDYTYQSANIWVFLKTDSSAYFEDLKGRLTDFIGARFGDAVQVKIGGSVAQGAAINEAMVQGKILNILQFGGVILLVTALAFRSLAAGLLVLAPLALVVVTNFGVMGWTGVRLDIATAIISPMAVGIGADYAIYLIWRIREELAAGEDERAAFQTALTTAGKAVLFVATAIAGGYLVLVFSWGFYLHLWMGTLIALAMAVSCAVALTVVPALILTLRPRFIFGRASRVLAPTSGRLVLVLMAALALLPAAVWAETPDATEIMSRNYAVSRVLDSRSEATFTLIHKSGQERVRKTVGVTKLRPGGTDNMRLVRFLSPADVKGTATLLIEQSDTDDDMWIYLPALKKVRRLIASNKKDSFVGTDFSYGDVIGHKVEDWDHRLLRDDTVEGQPCYVIESAPRSESVKANSGYAKRRNWVRKDNAVTVREESWDQAGQLLKVMTAGEVQLVDEARGKWQPMRLEATNVQTGHRTRLQFENFRANQNIQADNFTIRYLEREP
jgi:predicted RND superfamily exporter protein/outer membrane lipoprotein-sorting protein